jgi:hypothetical protein
MKTTLRASISVSIVLALLVIAPPARAQEVTRVPEAARHAVGLDAGLDAAFVARASYAQRLDLPPLHDTWIVTRFTLPFFSPDVSDWAFDAGLRATLYSLRDFRLALELGPVVRSTSNPLYSAIAAGAGSTLLLGYEGPRWGLSAEVDYEQIFTAYLSQSDLYRNTFYAGARDGFYSMPGDTARAGLRGGVRFGSVEIAARGGYDWTGHLQAMVPPFFATLGGTLVF